VGEPDEAGVGRRSARIFLSYRREDSSGYAGRLFDALVSRFGDGDIFMDIDTIAPGQDFVEVIEEALVDCEIVLVLIGPSWLNMRDKRKRRRLDNPDDFVRLEIEGALSHRLLVLPVLVGGAEIPSSRDLPSSLAPLARRNAFDLSDRRWHYDVQTLLNTLQTQPTRSPRPDAGRASTDEQPSEPRGDGIAAPPSTYEQATGIVPVLYADAEAPDTVAPAALAALSATASAPSPELIDEPAPSSGNLFADSTIPVPSTVAADLLVEAAPEPSMEAVPELVLSVPHMMVSVPAATESGGTKSPPTSREADATDRRADDLLLSTSAERHAAAPRAGVWAAAVALTALLVAGAVIFASRPEAPAAHAAVSSNPLNGVSCDSTNLCVAVDQSGNVITSAKAAPAPAWSVAAVDATNELYDVSCPTAGLCAAVDYNGNVITSTNPTGGAAAWSVAHVDGAYALGGVSCPSAALCVAVDRKGNVLTSKNPKAGAKDWSVTHVDGSDALFGVSCPSPALCVAVDQVGNVVTSTNPTGGVKAWLVTHVDGASELDAVSCPTVNVCVVADYNGNLLVSNNPTGGPTAWLLRDVDGATALDGVSCPTVALCVAVDQRGNVITSGSGPLASTVWTVTNVDGSNWLGDISCPSATRCVAVDQKGNAVTSASPAAGAKAWSVTSVYRATSSVGPSH
jgi:TIR domain